MNWNIYDGTLESLPCESHPVIFCAEAYVGAISGHLHRLTWVPDDRKEEIAPVTAGDKWIRCPMLPKVPA